MCGNAIKVFLKKITTFSRICLCLCTSSAADFLHMETLSENPLFKGCSASFLREIAVQLKPEIASPGEYIINKGDSAKAMYFIDRGDVDVLRDSESEDVIGTQTSGDFFGDVAILACCKRTASVRKNLLRFARASCRRAPRAP